MIAAGLAAIESAAPAMIDVPDQRIVAAERLEAGMEWLRSLGATATGDPLYSAISDGRRLAGMEHWLPLFEAKLGTLFDYLIDPIKNTAARSLLED